MQIGQCVDERVQTVVVRPVPPAPTTVGDTVCQGYYGEMRVTAPAGFVYRWYDNPSNDPATRPNFFYQGATFTTPDRLQADRVYWVRSYNNATGCYSNPTSVRTKVHPASTVAIQQSEDTTHLPSAIVTFYAHPNQAQRMAHYIWDFGDGSTSSLPRPTYQYHYPGTFQVTVTTTDTNGCVASGLSKVSVLEKVFFEAPTAFTPDGDLSNDYFHIIPRLMDTSAGFEIRIFNRYGREVYSSTDINFRWDGTTNGTPCPEGIYVYQMRGRTYLGKELVENGTVTLIR
jgi:gliding motility-associated-like protein